MFQCPNGRVIRKTGPKAWTPFLLAQSQTASSQGIQSTVIPSQGDTSGAPPTMSPCQVGASMVAPCQLAPSTVAPCQLAPSTVAPCQLAPSTAAPCQLAPSTVGPIPADPWSAALRSSLDQAGLPPASAHKLEALQVLLKITYLGEGGGVSVWPDLTKFGNVEKLIPKISEAGS
jgi:hypothetical protein